MKEKKKEREKRKAVQMRPSAPGTDPSSCYARTEQKLTELGIFRIQNQNQGRAHAQSETEGRAVLQRPGLDMEW